MILQVDGCPSTKQMLQYSQLTVPCSIVQWRDALQAHFGQEENEKSCAARRHRSSGFRCKDSVYCKCHVTEMELSIAKCMTAVIARPLRYCQLIDRQKREEKTSVQVNLPADQLH